MFCKKLWSMLGYFISSDLDEVVVGKCEDDVWGRTGDTKTCSKIIEGQKNTTRGINVYAPKRLIT